MNTQELTFVKEGSEYVARFVSQGDCVVEIERSKQGVISVSASIDGMSEVPFDSFSNPFVPSVIFSLEIAEGLGVVIKSSTEVLQAKMSV